MSEEIKSKRGRPPKKKTNQMLEANSSDIADTRNETYEFNSYVTDALLNSIFSCGIYDYFSKHEIKNILNDPIAFHDTAIRLSNFVYTKNGIVSNSIDYMTSLPCLDRVIIAKSKKNLKKVKLYKDLMRSTLKVIDDKTFVRNALFTQMTDGIAFFYFETKKKTPNNTKFMTDYDVENIVEINEAGINAAIITLPWQYTKIIGKKNGRYVLAFNLRYFDDFTGDKLDSKLKKYPVEIVQAYHQKNNPCNTNGDWVVLDNNKTMCRKIKCKDSEPWGRSLVIAALEDILYKDYFVDTKRNVLDEINNKILYQTFPEGREKGSCALTKTQQEAQHNAVKQAVINKNTRGGISFFSVAAGTKLDSIDVDVDIFDSKNESDLNDQISLDLGICSSLIGAMSKGNFASGQINLEMITAQLYTWIYEWQNELNFVINKNIIQDPKNEVEIYYFPTSFVNRKDFFDMMRSLYLDAGGSLTFLVASTGVDVDSYFSVLDEEIENNIFQKYLPHQTSYTMSSSDNDVGGRPEEINPTNENTIKSKINGSNNMPKPSTK